MFRACVFLVALLLASLLVAQSRPYNVGREPTTQDIEAKGPIVSTDGSGLPPGRGTATQGRLVYQEHCASCHGDKGQGTAGYPALVGGLGTLATHKPVRTVGSFWPYATTVWDYVNKTMPYQAPGSLKTDDVYSVTAYVLYLNGIIADHDEMNQKNLPNVRMPNRDGFIPDPRPDTFFGGRR
jgi:S-disulfanyl-L-cysteine oxidoreductase SoxD